MASTPLPTLRTWVTMQSPSRITWSAGAISSLIHTNPSLMPAACADTPNTRHSNAGHEHCMACSVLLVGMTARHARSTPGCSFRTQRRRCQGRCGPPSGAWQSSGSQTGTGAPCGALLHHTHADSRTRHQAGDTREPRARTRRVPVHERTILEVVRRLVDRQRLVPLAPRLAQLLRALAPTPAAALVAAPACTCCGLRLLAQLSFRTATCAPRHGRRGCHCATRWLLAATY